MRDDPILRLAAANPFPHEGPLQKSGAQGHGLRRRRLALGIVVAVGVIAVVLAATPAWALVRDVLPFWGQPSAPPPVMVDFSSLALDDPDTPMSPQADVANLRKVMEADFGGATHTLYVSPAKNNEFRYCYAWSPVSGGGCTRVKQDLPMGFNPELVPPHDASQLPTINPGIPPGELRDYYEHTVVDWFTGEAWSPVASVVIHFSDGTTVQPEITWVSAPINAGFWAYQVPNDKQSASDHVTEVDAYDANGNLVEQAPMPPMTLPVVPHS